MAMPKLECPVQARCRPLADLAIPLNVTSAAIYQGADKGYIGGTIRAGRARRITEEGFEYHRRHGYGESIPPAGTAAARDYDRGAR